jgi:hypothetical protein
MFRARAAETEHASIAKYELLEQSMEDMLHPLRGKVGSQPTSRKRREWYATNAVFE